MCSEATAIDLGNGQRFTQMDIIVINVIYLIVV